MIEETTTIKNLLEICRKKNIKLATAESCTGGLISTKITEISGSSDVFDRGFITYSNQAKTEMLNVTKNLLNEHGAVSKEVAETMAEGVLKNSDADIAISVTGIAGPTGGSSEKPVGLVYIGCAYNKQSKAYKNNFSGSRHEIRQQAAIKAVEIAIDALN